MHMERLQLVAAHLNLAPAAEPSHQPAAERPPGHRLEGVPIVTATRSPPGGELTEDQIDAYCRDGFLLVSGLIPPDVCAAATDAMWLQMAAENRDCGSGKSPLLPALSGMNQRENPSSWTGDGDWPVADNAGVMAVFTPAYMRATQLLAAAHARSALHPVAPPPPLAPPTKAMAVNRFPRWRGGWRDEAEEAPRSASGPPRWTGRGTHSTGYAPHADYPGAKGNPGLDHFGDAPADWRSRPQPVFMQHFVYLQTSCAPGGGGTLVWPGAHRALARAYIGSPAATQWMGPIVDADMDAYNKSPWGTGQTGLPHNTVAIRACEEAGLGPAECVPRPGDVLMNNAMGGHCGSANTSGGGGSSGTPRLAVVATFKGE